MSRGHDRERDIAAQMWPLGWVVVRAAGSLGEIDLVCTRRNPDFMPRGGRVHLGRRFVVTQTLFVEVKSDKLSPYANFSPLDRRELCDVSCKAGALPILAWWPPGRRAGRGSHKIDWIPPWEWPRSDDRFSDDLAQLYHKLPLP